MSASDIAQIKIRCCGTTETILPYTPYRTVWASPRKPGPASVGNQRAAYSEASRAYPSRHGFIGMEADNPACVVDLPGRASNIDEPVSPAHGWSGFV
jgi:hypothetical protein